VSVTISSVAPAYTFLENQLIETVKQSLRNELYANASFLCERLHAEVKNEDVKLLLAECYLGESYPD
jgi:thioredoxin-like negative regulator of GroEL